MMPACRHMAKFWLLWLALFQTAVPVDGGGSAETVWPAITRGKNKFVYALSHRQRRKGLTYIGSNERLRFALDRLNQGKPLKITTLGGSITLGDLRVDGLPWPHHVFNFMQDHYGSAVQGTNSAVGGAGSIYMSGCYNMHAPSDTDIFILEYSMNDARLTEEVKRAQERLIRKLMQFKRRPAIILAHSTAWRFAGTSNWWASAESHFNELSHYYGLASVSLRACCFRDILANRTGFSTVMRTQYQPNTTIYDMEVVKARGNVSFFWDPMHVDALTGARAIAELVIYLLRTTKASLKARDFTPELEAVHEPLPPPLHAGNYDSLSDRCFLGDQFLRTVVKAKGFDWVNEQKGDRARWGMIAREPGSVLQLKVDSTPTNAELNSAKGQPVTVTLSYLKSYIGMGMAEVTCVSGCTCTPILIHSHTNERESQIHLARVPVTQAAACHIQITVLNSTQSGGHKIKITGVIVSEEAGVRSTDPNETAFYAGRMGS